MKFLETVLIPYRKLNKTIRKIKAFYLPNIRRLKSNKLQLDNSINYNQKIFFSGKGFINIGKGCSFGYKLGGHHYGGSIEVQARYEKSNITIGEDVSTNNNLFVCAANKITIGNNCLIGNQVSIRDHDAHNIDPLKRNEIGEIGEVFIDNNVWIGNNVIILKNTRIGENAIIAAGAVVNGIVEKNTIVGGVPAKFIKKI